LFCFYPENIVCILQVNIPAEDMGMSIEEGTRIVDAAHGLKIGFEHEYFHTMYFGIRSRAGFLSFFVSARRRSVVSAGSSCFNNLPLNSTGSFMTTFFSDPLPVDH